MKRLVVFASAVIFSTAVLAQAPATQSGSGQVTGGPARENISASGGKKAPVKKAKRTVSGQASGGPAAEAISPTAGAKASTSPRSRAKSGQSSGGPRQ